MAFPSHTIQASISLLLLFLGSATADTKGTPSLEYHPAKIDFHKNEKLPRILSIITRPDQGGIVTQALITYEEFLKRGYDITLFVARGSMTEAALKAKGLPYYSGDILSLKIRSQDFKDTLYAYLLKICIDRKIDIIHCHKDNEFEPVKKVGQVLNIATIAHYHSHQNPEPLSLKNFNAFIAASPRVAQFMEKANAEHNLGIKKVAFIHPPHNEDIFLKFSPTASRSEFFKNNFGVEPGNTPVVCVVANIDPDKNHNVLLDALHLLIHQNKFPVHVILAGGDFLDKTKALKARTVELSIQDYVHFVGFTSLVPELLDHSDAKVLPSIGESFGIVLLEAALMQKPIILSDSAHMAGLLIQHEKSGLLFKSNSPTDLAYQIKRVLTNPKWGKTLGQNAYSFVLNNFSNKVAVDKIEAVYQSLFISLSNHCDTRCSFLSQHPTPMCRQTR